MSNIEVSTKVKTPRGNNYTIEWKDCDLKSCQTLNSWLNLDENIKRFAMFDLSFTDEMKYYKTSKNIFPGEIKNFIKIALIDEKIIGYIVLNYGFYDNKYVLGINPIVVSPQERNRGFAKAIIQDLKVNYQKICGMENLDIISANIDKKNIFSVKLFQSESFEKISSSKDNLFDLYQYKIQK